MQFWDWSSEAKAIKTITLRLDEQCESPLLLSRKCSLKDVGSKPTSQLIIIQRCLEQPGVANHKAADILGASIIIIKMKKQTNFSSDIQHQARARMLRTKAPFSSFRDLLKANGWLEVNKFEVPQTLYLSWRNEWDSSIYKIHSLKLAVCFQPDQTTTQLKHQSKRTTPWAIHRFTLTSPCV